MALPTNATALALLCAAALWAGGCASRPAATAGTAAGSRAMTAPAPPAPPPASAAAETPPVAPGPAAPAEPPVEIAEPLAELPTEEVVDELAGAEAVGDESETAALLQQSLATFEEAQALFESGESDFALAALDRAYELMARVPANGDALAAQEKENLRLLIARRVVEIHAARRRLVGDAERSIPRVVNAEVEREIRSFQGPERAFFLDAYRRSGRYRPMIVAQLQEAGLPEALSWLPLVESGFKERALSSARALGLWQFIASTGYRYGLERNEWVDERMDPWKATKGAIGYLGDLHALLGDWLTALAAYNCGEQNVLRQIGRQSEGYFDQFWDLYERLPRETRRYVPRFLATLAIVEDPGKYGFTLPEPAPPLAFETVEIARSTRLDAVERQLELPTGALQELNPELRRAATPRAAYPLRVPPGMGVPLLASLESLPAYTPPPRVEQATHRVRSGETLSSIAARYGTSVDSLMRMNRLRSAHRLSVGQRLAVPVRSGGAPARAERSATTATEPVAAAAGETREHVVRSGESLWQIAGRYGTTVEQLRRDNRLGRTSVLQPGQTLVIRGADSGRSR
ncbi:MAG: LysM peptidoglycan-binding domain-containing protein [Thermoanaerobaculia bacterium]|nr:LysM peptidoglycan-binding domain-containing protein [Thermoanaerobaculia bacterium]